MDRVAIVSDLHGNLTAWRAVIDDIAALGVDATYCLGDLAGKGPRGAEVVDSCRDFCTSVVQGNWDAWLAEPPTGANPDLDWYRRQLGPARQGYLAGLPGSLDLLVSGRHIRLFHASPDSVNHRVFATSGAGELTAMFANTAFTGFDHPPPTIVGYGDLHDAFLLPVHHRTLFNVGSVGNPLDGVDATYAVLTGTVGSAASDPWSLQFRRVPYDREAEVAIAEQAGFAGFVPYAIEVRTGIYRGVHAEAGLTLESRR